MEIQLAVCSGSTGLYFKYSISVTVKKGASLTAEKPREAMKAKNRNHREFFLALTLISIPLTGKVLMTGSCPGMYR